MSERPKEKGIIVVGSGNEDNYRQPKRKVGWLEIDPQTGTPLTRSLRKSDVKSSFGLIRPNDGSAADYFFERVIGLVSYSGGGEILLQEDIISKTIAAILCLNGKHNLEVLGAAETILTLYGCRCVIKEE